MAEDTQTGMDELDAQMDPTSLYREDIISDRRVGTLRMLTPITTEGTRDESRDIIFLGEAQIMTQVGPIPINFEIPAKTLAEAVAGYGAAAKQGLHDTVERLREMRRQQASQIVTPGMPGFQAPPAAGGSGIVMP
ncbi:hypothetical protein [Sutterella sp.]|uniref:hypothetical protein n=1 Tax=Sutterella sp. TaxID=1981025 RepID=UPI0026E058EF|nr:hypothetical protein [Sutterella sp.]MDO5530999.1 hypothetical protein [Sutterella sp.]